ncbi:MAG: hypothetical protein AAGF95_23380 [Chloroflexota bacterium]
MSRKNTRSSNTKGRPPTHLLKNQFGKNPTLSRRPPRQPGR